MSLVNSSDSNRVFYMTRPFFEARVVVTVLACVLVVVRPAVIAAEDVETSVTTIDTAQLIQIAEAKGRAEAGAYGSDVRTMVALAEEKAQAQTRAATTELQAFHEKQAAALAEADADLEKSRKFMARGLTVGVSLSVQTPLWQDDGQKSAKTVVMPYLMVLPGYMLGASQALRENCAASWAFGDEANAASAASGVALKKAKLVAAAILRDLQLGIAADLVKSRYLSDLDDVRADDSIRIARQLIIEKEPIQRASMLAEFERFVASSEWNEALKGRYCAVRGIGFWVGLPLNYSAATRLEGDEASVERDLKPVISFGAGYTPHAYFSILLGFTVSNVQAADTAGSKTIWSGTVGFGGNLDIVGALVK
jgi:hypothetical protein